MTRILALILCAVMALLAGPAAAQIVPSSTSLVNLPQTCDTGKTRCTLAQPVVNPDGSLIGSIGAQTAVFFASGNVANTAAVATMTAVSAKTNYVCGFEISSSGSTVGLVVNPTVTGLLGGTMTLTYAAPAGVLAMGTPFIVQFSNCLPASATNTAITLTLPALGTGNTNATVSIHGYTQ